ncbi:DNA-binding transcriptional regulator KdgR [Martelella lutilitoris]|uniref:DNA-binding transcriptional regulator KdgR n=1 Tax=Martelella lutilitoris TaxID=2583532 RepID=A0A5C4JUW5_9HYPH|nr:IclR family transcriptional regulator C-terminal domain-containing protein [Martelella lutilitoris]TNB48419.1 DNA-binding transcriptional regulator KdgR [Martelella lutilitoris]
MKDNRPKTENVAAVLKVFAVLETLAENRSAALAEIAHCAMTSKSTTHRLLHTMVELGYVAQDEESERYELTPRLFSLAAQTMKSQADILRVADKAMGRLSRATGESINLGILDGREQRVVYIHQYDSTYSLSMNSTLGKRNPLHSTSLGKALLAFRDDEEIAERLAAMQMEVTAPNTVTDKAVLREQLRMIRACGYSEEIEESEAGVRCIAAPVLNHVGKSIAAISIAFPLFRFDEARKDDYVALLKSATHDVSQALGYVAESA